MNKRLLYLFAVLVFLPLLSLAQERDSTVLNQAFVFWAGTKTQLTYQELASYCAPVFWFSPDEPELKNKVGKDITIPANFPFEPDSGRPVVYYQFRNLLKYKTAVGDVVTKDKTDLNNSVIDISKIAGFDIDYSHYYPNEAGLGGHRHDTEQAQFKVYVERIKHSGGSIYYKLILLQVTAKAHALHWYDNIYNIDTLSTELKLPFNILVEEGKHASCTDINGDGVYTPGYDVNVRTNDAWGMRDIIRTGSLFTADFQSYMAKVRKPQHRVFPPLPDDSPLKSKYSVNGIYSPENAIYELRPMPNPVLALPDKLLEHDMSGYADTQWPHIKKDTDSRKFFSWFEGDMLIKSFAFNARYDNTWGVSVTFPLLIVKNVETPLIGGWMVNRIYLQNEKFRDFGYNLLITPSASRFMDPYFAAGVEVVKTVDDIGNIERKTDFVMETGLKFRANVIFSPLKFLSFITDFWGVRIGIKNKGFPLIKNLGYVFEIGAGVW